MERENTGGKMRLLICGSRHWTNQELISITIDKFKPDIIIEGEGRGADIIARKIGQAKHITIWQYPANWQLYGRSAGPIRNTQMLDEGKPDLIVAFHNDIKHSKGTADMIKQATERKIKTLIVEDKNDEANACAK
jgi:hypothetical protein